MAIQTIPTASVGETWVQIGTTQTPITGSVVSFTGISSYKKIRILIQNVSMTANTNMGITLNNDTNSNYSFSAISNTPTGLFGNQANFRLTNSAGSLHFSDGLINYTNQACPKYITGFGSAINGATTSYNLYNANWNSTAVVNQIDFTLQSSTFSGANTGTIALYGAN